MVQKGAVTSLIQFNNILLKSLRDSVEVDEKGNKRFSPQSFFTKWFRDNGTPLFFLFKKNLGVTNIQFAELVALLRVHAQSTIAKDHLHQLQFASTSEFKQMFQQVGKEFLHSAPNVETAYELVPDLYSVLLRRVVVLDAYYGSSAVYLPPHISVDLPSLVSQSGYIHSCGESVFIRNMMKISKDEIMEKVDDHIKRTVPSGKKLFFVIYAHEDFSKYERQKASELRGGLDDVKMYVEKLYVGDDRLVSVIREMKRRFSERLVIPPSGSFKKLHEKAKNSPEIEQDRTLWLIVDHSTGRENRHPGEEQIYILYDQLYHNENPFHIFDENKPAWVDHTTIPHTLAGAMINITRPWRKRKNRKTVLVDPFVGTGTTWLEGLKFPESEVTVKGSDLNPMSPILTRDNLEFFSLSASELRKCTDRLKRLHDYLEPDELSPEFTRPEIEEPLSSSYLWAIQTLVKLEAEHDIKNDTTAHKNYDVYKELQSRSFEDRLLLYVAFRAYKRHAAALARESDSQSDAWLAAYAAEASALNYQIEELTNLRAREERGIAKGNLKGLNVAFLGRYSKVTSIGSQEVAKYIEALPQDFVSISDARHLQPNSADVIVTDPPYGFNTEKDDNDLAKLYVESIRKMVLALRDEGHLVFCLPDRSRTGRQLPFFTRRELITQQVLAICEEQGFEVINSASTLPHPASRYNPPYYWESERALRRLILHFKIRKVHGANIGANVYKTLSKIRTKGRD